VQLDLQVLQDQLVQDLQDQPDPSGRRDLRDLQVQPDLQVLQVQLDLQVLQDQLVQDLQDRQDLRDRQVLA
jgi:hypothetical protein